MEISLQLQQKQVLSQKQQQSVEILQMNALALSAYARELAEENPLLEWEEDTAAKDGKLLQRLEWLAGDGRGGILKNEENDTKDTVDIAKEEGQNLREYLISQINIMKIPEGHKAVLRYLAQSIEETGYLEADAIPMMMEKYPMKESTAERILREFQSLDPVGVGARNLRECLLLQLRQKKASALAFDLVNGYLEELAKNRLSHIAKELHTTTAAVASALGEIRSCQPKPGSGFAGEGPVEYVIPDVFVKRKGEELTVTVNGGVIPRLHISRAYVELLRAGANAETEGYISEKLKQAEWAVQCISRRESTLKEVAACIAKRQRAFFLEPQGQLAPLRMADVAEEMGIHESTVSRTVKEKYLQCERGVFPLHHFFSKAMTAEGEETVSADSIKDRLRAMINGEDKKKPLSDRELTERLTAEGIHISRRTVAKYREAMGIPGAGGRKEYGDGKGLEKN